MGKGRPATTNSLLRNLKKQSSKSKGVVSNMFIPNHSGDHSAGNVSETPSNDNDLVNKKYVDDINEVNDLTIENDLDVKGESKGSRVILMGGTSANYSGGERFMKVGNVTFTTSIGMVMPRAGSIVGMSCMVNVGFISIGFSGDFDYKCYKNGSVVFEKSTTISGTGFLKDFTTQARGETTFVAGDVISLSGVGNVRYRVDDTIICVELQFDT